MLDFFETLRRVARTESSVLIRGETGTGKELVARALHALGPRKRGPFRALNCATLTPELLASELFGHVRGAFTGAIRDRPGLFRLAHTGTIFLDEIAEMPISLQAQLLRVLQERSITPVGGTQPQDVDVRLLSATHQALRESVAERTFREDLMYRIRVVPLYLPPLRERGGDVEALLWHFIDEFNGFDGRVITKVTGRVSELFRTYPWPGNVRELRNVVEYAYAVGDGELLTATELPPELRGVQPARQAQPGTAEDLERERILEALRRSGGRKGEAAELLGINRSTLWRKLRELRIT